MKTGLGTKLRKLLAELDGDVQAVYEELDTPFRPRFYPIVRFLLEEKQASVGGIAEAIGVTQPAATQTINEMKRRGLLEVESGPDRRSRTVRLTKDGRQLADRLRPVWAAVHRAAANLDADLPLGLEEILDAALSALRRRRFRARILKELGDTL